jgi:hypothetical protein
MVLSKNLEFFGTSMDIIINYNPEVTDIDLYHVIVKDEKDNDEVDITELMYTYFEKSLNEMVKEIDWDEEYKIATSELNTDL